MYFLSENPDWTVDGADWPHRAHSAFVEAGDYRWHVQRLGAGPPALLIHGTGAATHSWAGLMPLLAERFDVVAFDLPGHGFTRAHRRRSMSLVECSRQVGALLAALEFSPALIVGHSAGAAIMVRMILDGRADPRLGVSLNGALFPFDGPAGFLFPVMARMLHYNPLTAYMMAQGAASRERVARLIERTGSAIAEDGVDQYARLMKRSGHIAGALAMMAHWDLTKMEGDLAGLQTRCAFLAGERDAAVPPEMAQKAADIAPNATCDVLAGLGHLAHEEDPARIARIITDLAVERQIIEGQIA